MWLQEAIEGICNYIVGMETVKSHDYTIPTNAGTIFARRYGDVVTLQITHSEAKAYSTGYTTILTLDPDYRPSYTVVAPIMDSNTSTMSAAPMGLRIYTSGEVQIYRYSGNGSSTTPRGCVSYIVSS